MIDKEKQIKKSIFKRFTACFLATFSALLFIFYLGYYCGSVYAVSEEDCPYFHYDGFQDCITSNQFNSENQFVYFYSKKITENASTSSTTYGIFYFDLQAVPVVQSGDDYIFGNDTTSDIKLFFYQFGNSDGSFPESINVASYSEFNKIKINFTTNEVYIYRLVNGVSQPWSFGNITDESGRPYGMYNFYTNIKEISQELIVTTTITPTLSGTVDLNRIIDGTTYKGSSFKIRFENHSNFPVQVRWYARRTGLGRLPTDYLTQYGNLNIKTNCAAMIFQHGNVYTKNMNSQTWFDSNLTMSQMKNSEWFSLGTNEYNNYKEIEILYTSTSFQPNVSYTWYTEAIRTGSYGSVCEVFYSGSTGENPYPTNHAVDLDGLTLCQSDTFQFTKEYTFTYESSGVGSDASCVGSDEDYLINTYSSSGRSDTVGSEGGDTSYKNLYLDKTSWLHEYSNDKWTNSGGSQYTDVLLRDANSFTAFMKSAFNIFPPEVNAVIVFTFIAVGFIIILKFVRG